MLHKKPAITDYPESHDQLWLSSVFSDAYRASGRPLPAAIDVKSIQGECASTPKGFSTELNGAHTGITSH